MRKQSMMGSSKYEFDPEQLDKDIIENQQRYSKRKQLIKDEIVSNFDQDGFRMKETFSLYLEVLRELKEEYNL